jgi:cytochrome c oxidase subunit II
MKSAFIALVLLAATITPKSAITESAPRRIEIHARRFSFQPAEITLKKGETVTLALTSDDVPHSLLIEGLHVNGTMTRGHITELTVTPATVGDFKGRCGRFCGSGHGSMTFVAHVVD